MSTKLYSSRSNAKRALKKHAAALGAKEGEFIIFEQGGKFGFQATADFPVEPKPEPKPKAKGKAQPATVTEKRRKSDIEHPVQYVWSRAEEMYAADNNVSRKAILAQLDKDGIAFYTARTQYQLWRKTKVESQPKEEAK